jgi:hypothetical protein
VLQEDWTALMLAAYNGCTVMAAELVRLGADIYTTSGGATACELAASQGHHEVSDMLTRIKQQNRATMVAYLAEMLPVWLDRAEVSPDSIDSTTNGARSTVYSISTGVSHYWPDKLQR